MLNYLTKTIKFNRILTLLFVFWVVFLLPMSICVAENLVIDDAYLEGIDAEADDIEFMNKKPKAAPESTGKKDKKNADKSSKKQDRNFTRFEKGLEEQYPASYQLYLKLDNGSRLRVFDLYQETGKYSEAKGLIMNLFFRR